MRERRKPDTGSVGARVNNGRYQWLGRAKNHWWTYYLGQNEKRGRQWRRRKARIEERRKLSKIEVKVGTLNVGTMTGKGREIEDMMERRKVDILFVQETRSKGEKARIIGEGCKLWYYGTDNKRNGVGIVLERSLVDRVIEIWRISDRVICLKMENDGIMLNIISAYAPQVECSTEEKEAIWQELRETVEKVPKSERVIIGADLNGHVGEGNKCNEDIMEKQGLGRRNEEGQAVVNFAKRMQMTITNTMFTKVPKHRVSYYSGVEAPRWITS